MSQVRQDRTPLASSAMMFAVTPKNATGTIIINKSISYILVESLAKNSENQVVLTSKEDMCIASILVAVYDHRTASFLEQT